MLLTLCASASSSRERRWLEERAALGSRWSWLQLRLAELDGRIQQVAELHRHIRSNKVRRMVGEMTLRGHPLITFKKKNKLRDAAGLSLAAVFKRAATPTSLNHVLKPGRKCQLLPLLHLFCHHSPSF